MADAGDRHSGHDPALVASLFDGDLASSDLATAQLWVATCPACASLHADLLALSQATRAQPTPARPRDFRLTAMDAARLRAEPVVDDARLTGVMTDRPGTTAHSGHDTTLVASLADHSLPSTERAAGMALAASCTDCAALHADLVALVAATQAMPTPPRPIDYTLTRGHAARLRPNPWRRLVAVVGSAHDGVTRPLAMGLTALGLVGVLVASAPTILQPAAGTGDGASSSQAVGESRPAIGVAPGAADTSGGGAAVAPAAPTADAAGPVSPSAGAAGVAEASGAPVRAADSASPVYGAAAPAPAASGLPINDTNTKGAGPAAAGAPGAGAATPPSSERTNASSGVEPLFAVSLVLLLIGLVLFLFRWGARRMSDG